jgi:hypothetical protein
LRPEIDELNGNIQGFANGRGIAVSPLAALPHKTTFHEIAHIVLGHTTSEKPLDSEQSARHVARRRHRYVVGFVADIDACGIGVHELRSWL